MDWRDYVDFEDRKEFLEEEAKFVKVQEQEFNGAADGSEKEAARAMILAKRLEFLAFWIEGTVS